MILKSCFYLICTNVDKKIISIMSSSHNETTSLCLVMFLCSLSLLQAVQLLRPITLNDESQFCWLISLNCRGMMVVEKEGGEGIGGSGGLCVSGVIALHARWG